ncbi:MAG: UDP-N-acetylglucosamine--N-acetylmuramyl-(pentapeptide) pyrophosphoryl-undecaprenol N-acetylglucosamine transferase [Elusimicrobiaceae bacterium]|nr:UDP-N-acetylglucosamine--N-acetylmuramyl-(pentapeptide) pyrophosphoryl-undecaprenol N-acetylglucosamine transferase [Elusimicrobiaceae bacterium]
MTNKRFLIASGGTGGHFYPGFALGKSLKQHGADVLFVVRKDDPAASVLAANELPYTQLDLRSGLPRSLSPKRQWQFIRQLAVSLSQTRRLIQEFRPDVTVGMGGYVSFPLIVCSRLAGVKTAVHESNAMWGLSNKICGYFCNLRMMGLPIKKTFKNAVLTSTPIRGEFAKPVERTHILSQLGLNPTLPTVLIMGGSQGAKGLNEALPQVIENKPQWQFIHLTGTRWFETQQQSYQGLGNVKILAYSEDIYQLMKSVDVMICRSGASTLAEVLACELPAVLVPYPYAAANHQYYNAQVLQDGGCARIVLESPQLGDQLRRVLEELSPDQLAVMRAAYKQLTLPSPLQATELITQLLTQL